MSNARDGDWYSKKEVVGLVGLNSYLERSEYAAGNGEKEDGWVFRGQLADGELATSLERGCDKSGVDLSERHKVERMIVREFRRVYVGEDRQDVVGDTLYCVSLLRHHGAPTRLLDFTYSKNVALYVGLKEAYDRLKLGSEDASFAVWCIYSRYMNERARDCYVKAGLGGTFDSRARLEKRNDKSFLPLYWENKHEVVVSENPVRMHSRLHLQRGVLLCPGNVHKPFMENLRHIFGEGKTNMVTRVLCRLPKSDLQKGFEQMMAMNISEESLFPGLDGLASSMNYKMKFYERIWKRIDEVQGWKNSKS